MTFDIDVLVIPTRPVARLADLSPAEVSSLFSSVQLVGKVIEKVYKADALTIACQVSYSRIEIETVSYVFRMVKLLDNRSLMSIFTYYRESSRETSSRTMMMFIQQ